MRVEHLGQLGARDDAVLHEVVRRDAAHRRERRLAGLPEQLRAPPRRGDPHVVGAAPLADRDDLVEARVALGLGAVELDEQRGAAPDRVAGVRHLLGGASIVTASIISIAPGTMPAWTISDTASPAARVRVEERDERLHRLRHRHHPQPDLRGDAERALGADERAEQVVAGRVELRAAERDDLAVGEHDLQPADVVGGEAVLEAVRAAGVLGDVAADRADDLARVGRVEEVRPDRGRDRDVRHARLDADPPVVEVDLEDAGQPRQHDQHAVGRPAARRRTGPEPAPRATHGTPASRARRDARRTCSASPGSTATAGRHGVLEQPVGLVRAQLVLVR